MSRFAPIASRKPIIHRYFGKPPDAGDAEFTCQTTDGIGSDDCVRMADGCSSSSPSVGTPVQLHTPFVLRLHIPTIDGSRSPEKSGFLTPTPSPKVFPRSPKPILDRPPTTISWANR